MSVNDNTLPSMVDKELVDAAQGQAELTSALAERLEMRAREAEEAARAPQEDDT